MITLYHPGGAPFCFSVLRLYSPLEFSMPLLVIVLLFPLLSSGINCTAPACKGLPSGKLTVPATRYTFTGDLQPPKQTNPLQKRSQMRRRTEVDGRTGIIPSSRKV